MSISRQEFELVASILEGYALPEMEALKYMLLCQQFADHFAKLNPHFNEDRFIRACIGHGASALPVLDEEHLTNIAEDK